MRAVGLHVIFRPMLLLMPFRHRVPAIARSRSAFVCFWVTAFSFFDFGRASRNENICGPPQLLHVDCFWLPGCPAMWLPLTLQSHLSQRHAKAGEPANAGNGSEGVCCVFIVICSPSPDAGRSSYSLAALHFVVSADHADKIALYHCLVGSGDVLTDEHGSYRSGRTDGGVLSE